MTRLFLYVIWLIQIVCLITILVCTWLILDRQVFAIVAASVVLATTLYLENTTAVEVPD